MVLAVLLVGAVLLGLRWLRDPVRIARSLTGLALPDAATLSHEEKSWSLFLGDGYSLWVFEIPTDFEQEVLGSCEKLGYVVGRFSEVGLKLRIVEEHVNVQHDSCYLLKRPNGGVQLSLVGDARLVVYVQN